MDKKPTQLPLFRLSTVLIPRSAERLVERLARGLLGNKPTKSPRKKPKKQQESCPTLFTLWNELAEEFFPEALHLKHYSVVWSNRKQIRTLASCSIERRRIVVARELQHESHHEWLSPLLYHEMCHAFLEYDVPKRNGKAQWHGTTFRELEARHPRMKQFDRWVRSGGWAKAVRSNRARLAYAKRRK